MPEPGLQTLVLAVPPSANRYWRHDRGRTHLSGEAVDYRQTVAATAYRANVRAYSGDVVLSFVWYRARRQGDLDNRLKQAIDALRSVLYNDDNQIVEIRIRREEDPSNPRLEVRAAADGTEAAAYLAGHYRTQNVDGSQGSRKAVER